MVRFGMASKVTLAVWLAARRAASVSANGITATKLLLSSITMKADEEPVPLDDGCGASDPGACAVPLPAASPGTPLMLMTTPEVGAVREGWFKASCAAWTWAWADATWAWPGARAFGFTLVCAARVSAREGVCRAAA